MLRGTSFGKIGKFSRQGRGRSNCGTRAAPDRPCRRLTEVAERTGEGHFLAGTKRLTVLAAGKKTWRVLGRFLRPGGAKSCTSPTSDRSPKDTPKFRGLPMCFSRRVVAAVSSPAWLK